jgi:hypothetical protein
LHLRPIPLLVVANLSNNEVRKLLRNGVNVSRIRGGMIVSTAGAASPTDHERSQSPQKYMDSLKRSIVNMVFADLQEGHGGRLECSCPSAFVFIEDRIVAIDFSEVKAQ